MLNRLHLLNKDIMDDYLNNYWDYFKQDPHKMRNRHNLNLLRSTCNEYFRKIGNILRTIIN